MTYKVLRISPEIHTKFKDLVSKYPDYTLSSATDILLAQAVKSGEIEESNKTTYKLVKELDQTFRSWVRQHEKLYSSRISEELLALIQELENTPTKNDLESLWDLLNEILTKIFRQGAKLRTEQEKMQTEFAECKRLIENQTGVINQLVEVVNEKLSKKGLF